MGTIKNCDGISLLARLPDKSVQAIITDPPWGVGKAVWDNSIPDWLAEARRVAVTVVAITAIDTLMQYPQPDWMLCWHRQASAGRSALRGFSHWTPILIYGTPGKLPQVPVDVFKTSEQESRAERNAYPHPCSKPVRLMKWLVMNMTKVGETVLDPFAGSGSTLVACRDLSRKYIGAELDKEHFETAVRRLQSSEPREKLFAVPRSRKRGSLFLGRCVESIGAGSRPLKQPDAESEKTEDLISETNSKKINVPEMPLPATGRRSRGAEVRFLFIGEKARF